MRLVEKKCPNCGAQLKFSYEDKETTCEFCKSSFEIERDNDIKDVFDMDDDALFDDAHYILTEGEAIAKSLATGLLPFRVVPIIAFSIIAITMFSVIFFTVRHNTNKFHQQAETIIERNTEDNKTMDNVEKTLEEKLKEENFIISFSDLTEQQTKDIHDNTLTILNDRLKTYNAFLQSHGKWSYVGMYLTLNNSGFTNNLYDVYSIKFKNVSYYAAVSYGNVKIIDGKLVVNMDGMVKGSLNNGSTTGPNTDTFGYESAKDLYNKVIRGELAKNKLLVSGNVYNE